MRLEELTPGAWVLGFHPDQPVRIDAVTRYGANAVEVVYRDVEGRLSVETVHRADEDAYRLAERGQAWSFDADAHAFKLALEARRIRLAHLFDPMLAVHLSKVDALPHQIDAVYGRMMPRQGLRFALCDDPGAGKTIMAGLYIRELMLRGELQRCLVVAPGSLVAQWQDELREKFDLAFAMVDRTAVESSYRGDPFESELLIARLDHLARNDELVDRACARSWDLVVVDEAHRMSAHRYAGEVQKTKRYRVGERLGECARNLLLMTATPHTGKEEDFQLWLGLLDSDRFEGAPREGLRSAGTGDLMRRMVKEKLLRFDGTKLFPTRVASTVAYRLSPIEQALYEAVTEYVRTEMNKADRLSESGDKRGNLVGFALTVLQRRLASSPHAIWQSLTRRRNRLERRLAETRGAGGGIGLPESLARVERLLADPDVADALAGADELEDAEEVEDEVLDDASAARTVADLEDELATLRRLEDLARRARFAGEDRKWLELAALFNDAPELRRNGAPRKLIVFTEHRDTLDYLVERIGDLLGTAGSVVSIHGGHNRELRRTAQERFTHEPGCHVLVATDAAGEGLNLQVAHLMVNYDLPWNPNRLEQRFGRIHRIGQTEVCHLWNLVAEDTREGAVYVKLLAKLDEQRRALGTDQVFDVLGEAFRGTPLRKLLIEAVRFGDQPDKRRELFEVIDAEVGESLRALVAENALDAVVLSSVDLERWRRAMDEAAARRLQPHHVMAFFVEAFGELGGRLAARERGRWQVHRVPPQLRAIDRQLGEGAPLLDAYERICFDKANVRVEGAPMAGLVCPGHPLLDSVVEAIEQRHGGALRAGTVLVDETDDGDVVRVLLGFEHTITNARRHRNGERVVASRRFDFVVVGPQGDAAPAGPAPYLDLREPTVDERAAISGLIEQLRDREGLEAQALAVAVDTLAPQHLARVRAEVVPRLERVKREVHERLTHEREWWDRQAIRLREQAEAGRQPRMNAEAAARRAEDMEVRRRRRLAQLDDEIRLSSAPPVLVAAAAVVPGGLLRSVAGATRQTRDTSAVDRRAVDAVLAAEERLGRAATEMAHNNPGYDVEVLLPDGHLLFVEVKGRLAGEDTVTVSRNQILTGLNVPERFVLALVEVSPEGAAHDVVRYVRHPFRDAEAPFFGATHVTFAWRDLWALGAEPS